MCKPVYAIDTPAGRIGIFEGDESEDFHGIRIFWIDENDAVIDLIAMIEGESANYLECNCPAFVTYGYRADTEVLFKLFFILVGHTTVLWYDSLTLGGLQKGLFHVR